MWIPYGDCYFTFRIEPCLLLDEYFDETQARMVCTAVDGTVVLFRLLETTKGQKATNMLIVEQDN